MLGALVVTFLIRYRLPSSLNRLHLVFIVATLAHHLRDADRRGIWFSPWSSPPIPYKLYILLILLLPLIVYLPLKAVKRVGSIPHAQSITSFIYL